MSDRKHGPISGWLHLLGRSNAAAQTQAEIDLNARISADVVLAQGLQSAEDDHDNVELSAGKVQQQLELARMERDRLAKEEAEIQGQVTFLVGEFHTAQTAGDSAAQEEAKKQGSAAATRLKAVQDEIHANEVMLAEMEAAGQTADDATDVADQQLEDSKLEVTRLRQMQTRAALARATTQSLKDATSSNGDGTKATLGDARSKIETDYAGAIGEAHVVGHSAAAGAIAVKAKMHQKAGNDLFAAALAAGKQDSVPQPVS